LNDAIRELRDALPPGRLLVGAEIPARNAADMSRQSPLPPAALALPATTEEVSKVLAICHRHGQAVVTQGGLTGLAAGAHPGEGEVALSLEKMAGIEELDRDSNTLTARAGTTLQTIQQAAEEAGLICAIDLGARGTASIGGNVATNAGGNQVLRYGMTRRSVLGLEVVLADGRVVRSLNKMMKNNAGYDWTQMFIGSEGTLGVITRVVLQLQPRPQGVETALLAVGSTSAAIKVLRRLERDLPAGLLVFEAMWREMYDIATTVIGVAPPLPRGHDLYLLVEAPTGRLGKDPFQTALADLVEQGLAEDAVVAESGSQRKKLWALRESVYEFGNHYGFIPGYDISIPLNRMEEAVAMLRRDWATLEPGLGMVVFGHLADSNIHVNGHAKTGDAALGRRCDEVVYGCVKALGGSISAEHGVGRLKKPYLHYSRSPPELELMSSMKKALDPRGILNPGRVL
jgi:FAD/FMN-containing dehydrogenase